MARVLWIGDAGCHTGFATVTHAIGERLVAKGHDVHVLATNFKGDYWPTTLKLYRPTTLDAGDIYGQTRFVEMLAKVEPDVVIILNDAHVILRFLFDNPYDTHKMLLKYRPIISYIPVDGYDQPPTWAETLTKVTNVVAMSEHGQRAYPGSQLVYHGVETDTFYPASEDRPIVASSGRRITSKREAKEAIGFNPNKFLILRVDKNSGRKDFAATWKAVVPILDRHDDVIVHFHTVAREATSGVDLELLINRREELRDRFFLPDLHNSYYGWSREDLAVLYNAADLFVTTSRGEGFGLTIAEALACGVPVVAQNVSAIPEVVGDAGVLIEPERMLTTPAGQDVCLANIPAFTEAIERLYFGAGSRRKLGAKAVKHVAKFNWDDAADRFHEYVEALASATGTQEA